MNNKQQSRRQFLKDSSAAVGLTLAGIHLPSLLPLGEAAAKARDAGAAMQILSAEEAADIEMITSMVIPSGETPGAREAGVVYFIDLALGGKLASLLGPMRRNLKDINALAGSDSVGGFSQRDEATRMKVMETADSQGVLEIFSMLTMFGMFSMPTYGGNRDHVGWEMIGFDHRHAWMPPFGYYDAEEHGKQSGGLSNEAS